MKKLIMLLTLAWSWMYAGSLDWQSSLPVSSDKPIMVFVEKKGCPWCQKMKQTTLRDSDVLQALKPFTPVKMTIKRWNRLGFVRVDSVPAIFFLNRDKAIVHDSTGYWQAGDFAFDIRQAVQKLQ